MSNLSPSDITPPAWGELFFFFTPPAPFQLRRISPLMRGIINFQLKQEFSWSKYSVAPSNRCARSAPTVPLLTVLRKYMDLIRGCSWQPRACELAPQRVMVLFQFDAVATCCFPKGENETERGKMKPTLFSTGDNATGTFCMTTFLHDDSVPPPKNENASLAGVLRSILEGVTTEKVEVG